MRYFIRIFSLLILLGGSACAHLGGELARAPDGASATGHHAARAPHHHAAPKPSREDGEAGVAEHEPVDLWPRLRDNMGLHHDTGRRPVKSRLAWYSRHHGFLERTLKRAELYLPYIVARVEERGMPAELALLPVVESAFQPRARSPMRAYGLWQFIPQTGTRFGLRQDQWHEGRGDVVESTRAALDYLQELQRRFDGDWLLALAAYNTGEKNVERAIRRNRNAGKATDFWSLRLPRETRGYVPNLLAVAAIIAEPRRIDFTLAPMSARSYFSIETLDEPLDLAVAAELADTDIKEFLLLNPAYRRWLSPLQGSYRLLIPRAHAAGFRRRLAALPDEERLRWREHRVRPGETRQELAARYMLYPGELSAVNDLAGKTLRAGQVLRVPTPAYPRKRYAYLFEHHAGPGRRSVYTVRSGDSLWLIAKRHGTSLSKLRRWNPQVRGKKWLRPGQKLVLWGAENATSASAAGRVAAPDAAPSSYTVKRGDSLWSISQRFGTDMQQLAEINRLSMEQHLQPGQKLVLAGDGKAVAAGGDAARDEAAANGISYVVRKGDSLWSIAQRFNTSVRALRSWNKLHRQRHLQPGQRLMIYLSAKDV